MKILLVDNFPLLRGALAELIGRQFETAQLVVAAGPDEAAAYVGTGLDLVVAGLHAGEHGCELERGPSIVSPTPLMAVDPRPDRRRALKLRQAGWRGHVPLDASVDLLGAAMALVAAGGSYFPLLMAAPPTERPEPNAARLSERQREVLCCLEQGKSNREIADELGIAVSTVKLHVHTILSVTGARNRTEAALRQRRDAG